MPKEYLENFTYEKFYNKMYEHFELIKTFTSPHTSMIFKEDMFIYSKEKKTI